MTFKTSVAILMLPFLSCNQTTEFRVQQYVELKKIVVSDIIDECSSSL